MRWLHSKREPAAAPAGAVFPVRDGLGRSVRLNGQSDKSHWTSPTTPKRPLPADARPPRSGQCLPRPLLASLGRTWPIQTTARPMHFAVPWHARAPRPRARPPPNPSPQSPFTPTTPTSPPSDPSHNPYTSHVTYTITIFTHSLVLFTPTHLQPFIPTHSQLLTTTQHKQPTHTHSHLHNYS